MKRVLLVAVLAVAILGLSTGTTLAAPGEPRVVQGTLEWPAAVSTQPFVVIRGDDGRMYYADINSAQRRTPGQLAAGSRVAVLGIEGSRPYEIAGIAIGAGDAAALGLVPGASSEPSASVSSGSAAPAEDMWRVDGTVESRQRVHRRPARAGWPHPVRGSLAAERVDVARAASGRADLGVRRAAGRSSADRQRLHPGRGCAGRLAAPGSLNAGF